MLLLPASFCDYRVCSERGHRDSGEHFCRGVCCRSMIPKQLYIAVVHAFHCECIAH